MNGRPWEIHHGDVRKVLRSFPENHFDGCLTDPPYGLSFMGARWDYDVPSVNVWSELLRVLKPGAHALIYGGSRTFHRIAVNVEDAGFEIRDVCMWLYGSGFPKSLNIAREVPRSAIESAEGQVIREFRGGVLKITGWVRTSTRSKGITNRQIDEHFDRHGMAGHWTTQASQPALMSQKEWDEYLRWAEVTPPEDIAQMYAMLRTKIRERAEASGETDRRFLQSLKRGAGKAHEPREEDPTWKGYGTALKPAYEPLLLVRKMPEGNVAQNCLAWGDGRARDRRVSDRGRRPAHVGKQGRAVADERGHRRGGRRHARRAERRAPVDVDGEGRPELVARSPGRS